MKFISLFFLLAFILLVNAITAESKSKAYAFKPLTDTVIKRRDTVKRTKPIKDKKSSSTSSTKSAVAANDTTKKNQNGLQEEVKYTSEDSTTFAGTDTVYLYGKARVTYTDFELDADYIRIDKKNHMLFAKGSIDPKTKRYVGRPISKQKNDAPLTSDSLIFNYETKKGHIWNPATKQQENYITHGEVKKLNDEEVAYRNIIFTTCDKPDPDFGIVITRGIGEKKQIVSGPAYLEIEGIPIPIGIPFGFFPKQDTQTSGVIIPTFGEDSKLGFYLRSFGYYIGLGDYSDLTTTGTYYSNGSYELNSTLEYRDRYKYNGNLSLSYGSHNYGLPGDKPARDFNITWSHSQNPNSNPGTTFSASVNAGTSSFAQNDPSLVGFNVTTLVSNTLRSSIGYGRTWAGTPFNFTATLSHSQDLTNKTVTLELPSFNFSMATISPFDSKTRVTEQKWYQKITIGYTLTGTNKLNDVPESQLFQSNTLTKRIQSGLQHTIPIALSLNVLKYFQFNTSINYTEEWYFQSIRKHYARGDSLVTDTVPGFQRAGQYTVSAGFSTKLYGQLHFKSGSISDIRHVMTPTISFSYRPDYTGLNYYNKQIVSNAVVPYPVVYQRYSIFDQSVFGGPSGARQAGINFSLDNSLEAKLRPKSTDTSQTPKKIWLLQDLIINTFYNFAADSFKLQLISISGHTSFLHDRLNLNFGATFNPYETKVLDSISGGVLTRTPVPVNRYTIQDGRLPTLSSFNLSASMSLNPTVFHPKQTQQPGYNTLQNINSTQAQKLALINSDPAAYVDFNVPYNITLNYSFNYANSVVSTSNTNTLMITGDVNITPKWKIQYNTNYDLKARQLSSATSFSIYRDLHCWDLSVQWLPFGYYKSYNVTLRVKSTILQDLKLSKRSDYTSNQSFAP